MIANVFMVLLGYSWCYFDCVSTDVYEKVPQVSVFWENANQGLEPKTALREGTALVVTVLWEKANQDLEPKTALPVKYRPDLFNSI